MKYPSNNRSTSLRPLLRVAVLAAVFLLILGIYGVRLLQMQVVDGAAYAEEIARGTTKIQTVDAARGEILDRYGKPFAVNTTQLNIVFDRAFLPYGEENRIILELIELLQDTGETWEDDLPVTETFPFAFTEDSKAVDTLHSALELGPFATIDDVMHWLTVNYKLDAYAPAERRLLAGVRYGMLRGAFSVELPYTFAQAVSIETATKILAQSERFPGVDIVRTPVRQYVSGSTATHLIGMVGPIYAEEYAQLDKEIYSYNDIIGKGGLEKAFESQLRGKDGERTITLDNRYHVLDAYESVPATPGNTLITTIDCDLQKLGQQALADQIVHLQQTAPAGEGREADSGAVVAIDVKRGEVLLAATWPSYDVETFRSDYSSLANDPLKPMYNRALQGTYAPGSCYKPAVAIGGLTEGIINPSTTFFCGGTYTYFAPSYTPTCLSTHRDINVMTALRYSCNIFFYELGRLMGIDTINKYSSQLGLGEKTGIELAEAQGTRSSPESRAAHGLEWYPGDVIQSAIGQLDNSFSPIQLANYAATIANRGKRMKLTLVKSIKSYNLEETIYEHTPEVAQIVEAPQAAFETVVSGMVEASRIGTARAYFADYPITVASKTGTPQTKEFPNSTFICFAPAEDPEIAIAVVIEKGWHGYTGAPVAKAILDAYFFGEETTADIEPQNVLLP